MASPWLDVGEVSSPACIAELPRATPDPIDVYPSRYITTVPAGNPQATSIRTEEEVFSFFEPASSVLLFGSGHSYWANTFLGFPNVDKVSVLDYVQEAGTGLSSGIDFYCDDIRNGIKGTYDYIYSSHTVEHFTRDEVLNCVLPECLKAATKGVIFVVPFQLAWSDEPSHRCLFYLGDELFALASRYKVIRDDLELALWFDVI